MNVVPLRAQLARSDTPAKIRNLRTNGLKSERELWQACLFAHGLASAVLNTEVYVAPIEAEDFDCVVQWFADGTQFFAPVQLKELVPENVNSNASLNEELIKLSKKYVASPDLVVAFYLNRQFRLDLNDTAIPKVNIAELWFFGAVSPDLSRFMLWGNLMKDPAAFEYQYPGAE